MASNSKNVSPLQYPKGNPIKGAIAMSNRHNWDAVTQHIQSLEAQVEALQARVIALEKLAGIDGGPF